jgi:hypothetical protein
MDEHAFFDGVPTPSLKGVCLFFIPSVGRSLTGHDPGHNDSAGVEKN